MAIAAAARVANAHCGAFGNLAQSLPRNSTRAKVAPCSLAGGSPAHASFRRQKQNEPVYHQFGNSCVFELPHTLQVSRGCRLRVFAKQATAEPPAVAKDEYTEGLLDCVVVGAGVSGLCTAQALRTEHESELPRILVTEARERVGGNITTVEKDGYLWEEGPNSFQPGVPMLKMIVRNSAFLLLCHDEQVIPKWGN